MGACHFAFPLWRRCCDRLHQRWLSDCLSGKTFYRVLKTDLFDEAQGDGLVSMLRSLTLPGGECHGLDISPTVVAQAKARHPGLYTHCCDVRRLPLDSGLFDLIVSDSTLDHFERPADLRTSLRELHRVLAPGGLLAISLDNPRHPLLRLRNRFGRPWMGRGALLPYFVGHTLSLAELSAALRAIGFEPLIGRYLMHAPRFAVLHLSRLLPPEGTLARWFQQTVLALEVLEEFPTAPFTGHFVTVLARKPLTTTTAGG